ncbi:MAG: SpoIIE family protein phosphatase, partial [Thermodesulfobacteriota bacterium]
MAVKPTRERSRQRADNLKNASRGYPAGKERPRHSEYDYREIFDDVNDAILILDIETGTVEDFNCKAIDMWGYPPEEMKGIHIGEISSGESPYAREDAFGWIKKAVVQGPQVFEWLARTRKGHLFWVEINLKCSNIAGENRILAVMRDIARRKKTEFELKQARENAEQRVKELSTINRFAMAIGSTLDLAEILQTICREMVGIFKARNTGIGLLNPERTLIELVAFHTTSRTERDSIGLRIPLADNASTHYVLETGRPIVVPDAQNNPLTASMHEIFKGRGTECIMIIPLLARGEVIGTIGVPTSEKGRVFTSAEVSLAQTIASQITSVIENARLYAKTEKAKYLAERELEIGRRIQAGFFPDELPKFPNWEIVADFKPAHQVSGDFYDVFLFKNAENVGLVIADVCDKGVGAALFMALFRSLIRSFATLNYNGNSESSAVLPADILKRTIGQTNTYIARTHGRTNMFATLFFGILNLKTGELNYINGGHDAPVVVGPKGVRLRLQTTGPAVGMFPDMVFDVRREMLYPEDMLFMFTDGVIDAQSPAGKFYTKKRLIKLVSQQFPSAKDLLNHVRNEIETHISNAERCDDVTL